MRCDLCGHAITLNRDDFVIREEPTTQHDTTLVTYAAHQRCHEAFEQPQQQTWSFTWRPK